MNESIQTFIDRSIVVLKESTSASSAAQTMSEQQIGCVLVCNEENEIKGMVTDRDLALQVLGQQKSPGQVIGEVMSSELVCVERNSSLSDVLKKMELHGIRRIPVIDKNEEGKEKCVGLITLDDLLLAQVVPIDQLSRIVKAQLIRRLHRTRHPSRAELSREQTLHRFVQTLSDHMDLSISMGEKVTVYLLKQFLQKVPAVNAAHVIAQLPSLLHELMMNLPAGPNREIRAGKVLEDLETEFQFTESESHELVRNFWKGLRKGLNPQIVDYLGALLPRDFRQLVHHEVANSEEFYVHGSSLSERMI